MVYKQYALSFPCFVSHNHSKPNLARYSDTRQNRYGFSEIRNFAYFLVIKICTRILVISHGFLETFEIRKHLICFVMFFLLLKTFWVLTAGRIFLHSSVWYLYLQYLRTAKWTTLTIKSE